MKNLRQSQLEALTHVRLNAEASYEAALDRAREILNQAGIPMLRFTNALAAIQKNAPIDVSFHPDRPAACGKSVVASLLESGVYKNQFETGVSNGGLTAYKGGNRDLWERRLFGGAYQGTGVTASDRPKYGALNLFNHWDGACPRFGSCYFRLKPTVAQRSTYAYGDSSTNPNDTAVIDLIDVVLTRLIADVFYKHSALGCGGLRLDTVLENLANRAYSWPPDVLSKLPGRTLDDCIEVHIHGKLDLAEDVESLAVDQSFFSTPCGNLLTELSHEYGFPIRWNPRFEIATNQIPPDFRGPEMVPLADRIAPDGLLNAARIGEAVVALGTHPEHWIEWGTGKETLQYMKQIWHVLLTFGEVRHGP